MRYLVPVAALLINSHLALAAPAGAVGPIKPVEVTNELTVSGSVDISNTPDVVVTNDQNNPVPVTVIMQNGEQLFVYEQTVTFLSGENRASRDLFTVPAGRTLLIEHIDGFNAGGSVGQDGQETSLHVSYFSPGSSLGSFPGASVMFESKGDVQEMGSAKVFLPVPADSVVRASLEIRDAAPFTISYRITVAGRLVDTPVRGPFD